MFIFFLGLGDVGKGVGGAGFSGLMLKGSRFQNCFKFYPPTTDYFVSIQVVKDKYTFKAMLFS